MINTILKIKLLDDKAKVPTKAHISDAGADIYATGITFSEKQLTYHTSIALGIPSGYYVEILPRSSISKMDLRLSNNVGVIDTEFLGEITFKFDLINDGKNIYNIGDRIGQMILRKKEEYEFLLTNDLGSSKRGTGSYGSTGR